MSKYNVWKMKKIKSLSIVLFAVLIAGTQLFAQNDIRGTYYYQGNTLVPLPNIHVELFDLNDSLVTSTITDDDGVYSFEGIPNGEYYIASSTNMASAGVTLVDAYKVLFYLFGWYDLTEIEFEVADVNNSTAVTWSDYGEIMAFIIFSQPFSGGDWEFEEIAVDFSVRTNGDTINPWGSSHGDVEGEWEPIGRDIVQMPSRYYNIEPVSTGINSEYIIGADYDGNINGFNLNLAYASDIISISSISGPDENFTYLIDVENGLIKLVWLNENQEVSQVRGSELFKMEIALLDNLQQQTGEEILYLMSGGLLIDSENNKLNDIDIKLPLLQNKQTMNIEVDVYPNPVVSRLNFNIISNKQSQASLSVYNLNGKLVNYIEGISFYEGEQAIAFDVENLVPGNYVYSLDLRGDDEKNITGRFVKSK